MSHGTVTKPVTFRIISQFRRCIQHHPTPNAHDDKTNLLYLPLTCTAVTIEQQQSIPYHTLPIQGNSASHKDWANIDTAPITMLSVPMTENDNDASGNRLWRMTTATTAWMIRITLIPLCNCRASVEIQRRIIANENTVFV